MPKTNLPIDPAHLEINPFDVELIYDVWKDKYAYYGEKSIDDMLVRVAKGIYAGDKLKDKYQPEALEYMRLGLWMPAGRILAGAGTEKTVTLMNCYVNETVGDSMEGIHRALGNVMFTLQQGGGIGTDFSTLRPQGAELKRTGKGSEASGAVPFMHQWNATSQTVKSAGDRRGAMMGTISDTHPDLPAFITCKQEQGALTQFNISVLVSDAFMEAVEEDEDWMLHHNQPPAKGRSLDLKELDFVDDGEQQYVYAIYKARELWDMILKNTYEYSEPGVIFIDRVNDLNNLQYCETIRCTNPCGEQPLPPNGTCNLGAVNLARLVKNPFTKDAVFDFDLLQETVRVGVRFLDNVIDQTLYPLEQQKAEELAKRRLGLGVSGLADCLAQLRMTYGSAASVVMTDKIEEAIAKAAYQASIDLAEERGSFPLFDAEEFVNRPFIKLLGKDFQEQIRERGIRNGVLLTIAPTGTTSLIFGNISSGLEPVFLHEANRKVFQANDEWKEYGLVPSYGLRLYREVKGENFPIDELPDYMVTYKDLKVDDHLRIQAACQKWVDASISKTINLDTEISFEDFTQVYSDAYRMGCKGCTTYRPSDIRGSVLSDPNAETKADDAEVKVVEKLPELPVRPECLQGSTYKIKWPSWNSAIYLTINSDENGKPLEIFIQSKDARHQEWITALTVMISAIMRLGGDVTFIPSELKQVVSTHDSSWSNGRFYGSLVSKIGDVIEQHFITTGVIKSEGSVMSSTTTEEPSKNVNNIKGELCPSCGAPTLVRGEGCKKCLTCGSEKCGG